VEKFTVGTRVRAIRSAQESNPENYLDYYLAGDTGIVIGSWMWMGLTGDDGVWVQFDEHRVTDGLWFVEYDSLEVAE
jgi:hypothetical protein